MGGMGRNVFVLALLILGTACTRWSPQPVPLARAFADSTKHEVAIRLQDDSTHWWRIRQAHLMGDSIVGLSRKSGQLQRVTIPVDRVRELVVRESDTVGNDALLQLAEMGGFLGMILFIGTVFPLFTPKGWSL